MRILEAIYFLRLKPFISERKKGICGNTCISPENLYFAPMTVIFFTFLLTSINFSSFFLFSHLLFSLLCMFLMLCNKWVPLKAANAEKRPFEQIFYHYLFDTNDRKLQRKRATTKWSKWTCVDDKLWMSFSKNT